MDKMFDLSKMTSTALEEAADILNAYANTGVPEDFYDDGVQIAYNEGSGCVFLTNEDYQVAVLESNKLVSLYFTPYEGWEGTYDELIDFYKDGRITEDDDLEYLRDIAEAHGDFSLVEDIDSKLGNESEETEDEED